MTYYIKEGDKKMSHVFSDAVGECDGAEHVEYPVLCKGLKISRITCPLCLKMVPEIVMREFTKLMAEMER